MLHGENLAVHGGALGIRDAGLLESALMRPRNLAAYETPDVFDCAASYAFGLVKNHPFVDGNKRIAFLSAALFLRLNGFRLIANQEEATFSMLDLAASKISEEDYALFLRQNSQVFRN